MKNISFVVILLTAFSLYSYCQSISGQCCDEIKIRDESSYPGEKIFVCKGKGFQLTGSCLENKELVEGVTYYWEIIDLAQTVVHDWPGNVFQFIMNEEGYYTVRLTISCPDPQAPGELMLEQVKQVIMYVSACDPLPCNDCIPAFAPIAGKTYVITAWTKEENYTNQITYENPFISLIMSSPPVIQCTPSGKIINGWQKIEKEFTIPSSGTSLTIELATSNQNVNVLFDDVRIFPKQGSMKGFVYDPVNMRFVAELDENHYATFYEYDDEGKLIRVKKETERGVMTVQENRNNYQKYDE